VTDLAEPDGVVVACVDGLREVGPDLGRVDVESSHELEVPDVVAAEQHVHEARDPL
jgi:hypothetical protein